MYEEFGAANTVAIAVAQEDTDLESHKRFFGGDWEPPFDVVMDANRASTTAYDRTTAYLISPAGIVQQVFPMLIHSRPSWRAVLGEVDAILNGAAPAADPRRAFDFWIGTWAVTTAAGQPAGSNEITSIHGGAALREEWTSARGGTGTSLNAWDAATGKWRQTWVDTSGTFLLLAGGLDASGRMVMTGERPAQDGGTATHRIVWTPLADGRVTQVWTTSKDAGATWTTAADLVYTRRE